MIDILIGICVILAMYVAFVSYAFYLLNKAFNDVMTEVYSDRKDIEKV